MSVPAGFRWTDDLLVNDGPLDAAAGQFTGVDLAAPALWSRQVLTDGRLRALAVVPPVEGGGPQRFQAVHATAERVAARLGVGAVEVAVWWADAITAHGTRSAHYTVTALTAGDLVVALTDAALTATALETALATAWPDCSVLVLASGTAGGTPTTAAFAAELAALRTDITCRKGGVV